MNVRLTEDSVEITTLPNGFRVATDRMDSVETVSLGVWVGIGTRHEDAAENGVSHLLEHMAFKGTRRRSARDIAVEIENVGGVLNAYTGREQTAYYAKVLAEDTALALDLIADILQHSTFDAQELERERGVIIQEIGQAEDTPDDIVFDHFQETAFPEQSMGRPVLGRAEIIAELKAEAIAGYMLSRYRPGNMVLAAAGRVEHRRLVDLALAAFDQLPPGGAAATDPARYQGGELRLDRDLEQAHIVLGFDGIGIHDPDYYASAVLSQVLGGGMSSRLFQEVREKRGLVYGIHSFASAWSDAGIFGIYAGTGEKEAAELLPIVCDEMLKLTDQIPEEELRRAGAQLKAGILMAREKTSARCEQLAAQLLIHNRPVPSAEIVARVDAVTGTDLARVARRLMASTPTLTTMGPVGAVMDLASLQERLRV
ncbi:putative Zn-dependent peptidase [Dongia mobilis]|uniref:Putative Zn-dependent peptidase n=1 Tax=Dongia mobilis TaxID=578943 RepID=A0A4R6WS56_9PROT|nr:putative Zn-dependent peptidase [Dongia mobilis]